MANTDPTSDVLHNEGHSKLTAEEIAKAVARHNKKGHSAKPAEGDKPKSKKGGGKA